MKAIDGFKFSLLKTLRDKHKYFFVTVVSLCSFITLIVITFYFNVTAFIDNSINKNPAFRTILVQLTKDDDLTNINHITDIYSSNNAYFADYSSLKNEKLDGWVILSYGTLNNLPQAVYGKNIDVNSEDEVICPIDFYPDSGAQNFNIKSANILKKNDTLNKSFSIEYFSYKKGKFENGLPIKDKKFTKTFKIVGLYDNKPTLNYNNECFISAKVLKKITDINNPYLNNNSIPGSYILVDNLTNVNYVKNELYKKGYTDISMKNTIDFEMVKVLNIGAITVLVLVIIVIIILTIFYIKKKILNEKENLGILRALGFKKREVLKIYIMENIITSSLAFLIAILLFVITFLIIKYKVLVFFKYFGNNLFLNCKILFISFSLTILFSGIVCYMIVHKNSKNDITRLLESEE